MFPEILAVDSGDDVEGHGGELALGDSELAYFGSEDSGVIFHPVGSP